MVFIATFNNISAIWWRSVLLWRKLSTQRKPPIKVWCDIGAIVVGFTTTYTISAYHYLCCEFESRSRWGVLDIALCDKVCQWLVAGRWFSSGTPVSSTNKKLGFGMHRSEYKISNTCILVKIVTRIMKIVILLVFTLCFKWWKAYNIK
jgi:hypothetical protein